MPLSRTSHVASHHADTAGRGGLPAQAPSRAAPPAASGENDRRLPPLEFVSRAPTRPS